MGCVAKGGCGTRGVPMSRYSYDSSLAPNRSSGWRSLFRNVLTVGAVAAIAAISGAVVALDLLGNGSAVVARPVVARQAHPASLRVAQTATQPASAAAAVQQAQMQMTTAPASAALAQVAVQPAAAPAIVAVVQPIVRPATVPAPQAVPAPQPAPAASAAPVAEPKTATAKVPDSELTFSSGYARRRAVHEAATSGSGAHVARVESQTQVGRVATKMKRKTTVAVARQSAPQDQSGAFARFDQRHQALALDQRDSHTSRRPPQQQGGLFGGGFFRGIF